MQSDSLTLKYLIFELGPILENSFVNKVSELERGILKIKLHTKQGSKDLIISGDSLFLSGYSHNARHGKTPFAESLKKQLYNKRIIGIEQHGSDRIVLIKFLEETLILEFINEGNKILIEKSGKIISCEKKEEWADRVTKKGEIYKFPKQSGQNPQNLNMEKLTAIFSTSEKDAIRTLISKGNVPPLLAEETFHKINLNKNKKATELSKVEIEKIFAKLSYFLEPAQEKLLPSLYKSFAYPFKLEHLKEEPKQMPTLNSCFDESFAHPEEVAEVKKEEKKDNSTKLEFMRGQQENAREKFKSQIDLNAQRAELIYKNFAQIETLSREVQKLAKSGFKEKEIAQKIHELAKTNPNFSIFRKVDLKTKKFEIEL